MVKTESVLKAPYLKLKMYFLENDIKHKDVAEFMQMAPALFSQKINKNNSNFTIDEASMICEKYDLDMHEYFFNKYFSKMRNEVK